MFNRVLRVAAAVILCLPLAAQAADPNSDDEQVVYAIGFSLGQAIANLELDEDELAWVHAGLTDAASGDDAKVDVIVLRDKIQAFAGERATRVAEKEKVASAAFLAEAEKDAGAVKTDSGLIYVSMEEGDGASPASTDTVTVHYTGTLRDGTVFDSSRERGQPASFGLNRVISCWTEGVQMMKVGGRAKLVCPSDIAYGDRGSPPRIAGGATLVFDVELIGIEAQ